ncbi:MAG: hypothetical protein AMS16_06140 [Planctomycetes bacterium DG_58]|nr:MAG: hypothetical protein AMS16_06140 [Planctomycetes bacterium DG_58]KPL04757.1 MAG: hypothetical protein AMK75_00660 [Planctomycetes bacterium SM23_65]
MLEITRTIASEVGEWRRQYRAGSVLLVVVLVALSAAPVVILLLMASLADRPLSAAPLHTRQRVLFDLQPKVRVALAVRTHGGAALPIKVTGGYRLVNPKTHTTLVRGARLTKSPVEALSRGVVITVPDHGISKTMHLPCLRIVPTASGTLHVARRRYRGVLDLVYESGGRMTLVNELDLEDYVGGVVAPEMFYYWPREALRAQAVVARTYTLARVLEARAEVPQPKYDLEANYLADQEYHGITGERATTREAVSSTRGLVLTHNGKVFRAYFSSCCGGHTEACGLLWEDYKTIPPLAGKPCDYCKHSKWYNWRTTIKLSDVERALKRAGRDVGSIQDVQFVDSNNEGHIDQVTIKGTRRTHKMMGNDFRLDILAANRAKLIQGGLNSMNFSSRRVKEAYELTGHGRGHGCGMCQYGAYGLAIRLKSYKDILAYYYPEAELWKVY